MFPRINASGKDFNVTRLKRSSVTQWEFSRENESVIDLLEASEIVRNNWNTDLHRETEIASGVLVFVYAFDSGDETSKIAPFHFLHILF